MLNILAQSRVVAGVQNAMALIEGHHRFMNYNTGLTLDAQQQHYIANPDGVLSNNRHFIAASQMEYQPNGDGTTEGQSLQVLGYCYAYLATKDQKYLDKAKWYWDGYVAHYYAGDPIPETPQRWIANWIVNSKEPVPSNWPIDAAAPTHSGFKGSMMTFVNGVTTVPHDAPNWGQFIDKATFAFDGHLTWDAINASVQFVDAEGNIDWTKDGTIYDVDWIINWEGKKINWDGDVLSEGHPLAEMGMCKLKDITVQGDHKFNYATRQPVEFGGRLIERNEVQHNRPLHVPLLGSRNQRGNAADGEEWFMDACYMLWKITGEDKYKKAMDSCHFTAMEYTDIDSSDMFFRQSTDASTPFTDGISYDFTYPSDVAITYGRDALGYITIDAPEALDLSLEQQAVWFRVGQQSSIRVTYGGVGKEAGLVSASPRVLISPDKRDPEKGTYWTTALPDSTDSTVKVVDTPLNQYVQMTKTDGTEYILADLRAVSSADEIISTSVYVTNIIDGRNAKVVQSFFPDDDGWYAIGNYLQPGGVAPINSITYKADADFNLRFADDEKWRWWWMLPATNGEWVTKQILKSEATLSGYQPDAGGRPNPSFPQYNEIEEFSILFDDSSTVNATFSYYCINDIPPRYTEDDGYTMNFRITLGCKDATGFNALLGNCKIVDYRDDNLAYTPGLIPFSNIYEEGTDQLGAWHGMPYPGYQYPFIYSLEPVKYARQLNNMVDFLYDSQLYYNTTIGVMGPGASAYIWNRWDNYKYGTPDTFTMYHWGDGTAWSGYQPRAFQGACRAWQELVYRGEAVPDKLKQYVNRWITFLGNFIRDNDGRSPTDFSATAPPTAPDGDFTGHMCGLWLTGVTQAGLAGCDNPMLDFVAESCLTELTDNYVNTGIPSQIMNGSWSPAIRLNTGNGVESNGMFFGFWSGEILRALGSYIMYKTQEPLKPLY